MGNSSLISIIFINMTIKKLILSFILTLLILPVVTNAQGTPNIDITKIFNNFLSFVLNPIFFGLIIVMFVWAGILYITANGDPSKIQKANQAVIWAIVGIAVGLLANFIIPFVKQILGLP